MHGHLNDGLLAACQATTQLLVNHQAGTEHAKTMPDGRRWLPTSDGLKTEVKGVEWGPRLVAWIVI